MSSFDTFATPLYPQVTDTEDVYKLFQKYSLIPVFSNNTSTSNCFLNFLYDLCEVSPSQQSCIKDMQTYAFGNALGVVEKTYPYLMHEEEGDVKKVEVSEKVNYAKYLKKLGISFPTIIETSKSLFTDETISGNYYMMLRIVTAGDSFSVKVTPLKQKNVMYVDVKDGNFALVTEKFDELWWTNNKPKIYPVTIVGEDMNFKKEGNDYVTLIHFKANGEGKWYGRPKILCILDCMIAEYKTLLLNAKISSTELVSKLIFFFEEQDPTRTRGLTAEEKQIVFNSRATNLRAVTTNEGEQVHSIAALEYPFGTKEPKAEKLQVNRDVNYATFSLDNAASMIYSINGWSKELTGMVQVKTGIGANILNDLFTIKNSSTIEPLQRRFEAMWTWIIDGVEKQMGLDESQYAIKFPNVVESLVGKITDQQIKKNATKPVTDLNNNGE